MNSIQNGLYFISLYHVYNTNRSNVCLKIDVNNDATKNDNTDRSVSMMFDVLIVISLSLV